MKKEIKFCLLLLIICCIKCSFKSTENLAQQIPNTQFYNLLINEWTSTYDIRRKSIKNALKSQKKISTYQKSLRSKFSHLVGEVNPPSETNYSISSKQENQGFSIENIIFESEKNHHITANLYKPKGIGPFPSVLFLSGHEIVGKAGTTYQQMARSFASNGFVVLTPDPISQGERIQLVDNDGKSLTRGATTEHTLLNAGSMLVGTSLPALQLRDNIAAVDLLTSLSIVDDSKIGVVGNSGGGNQLAYLWAFDDRLKVAAPCSFVTERERYVKTGGPQDGCQQLPGESDMEIADFFIMQAPKPLLIVAGEKDFVDFEGTQNSVDEMVGVYRLLNKEENIKFFPFPDGHGMGLEKREEILKWFCKWLQPNRQLSDKAQIWIEDQDLWSTRGGNVLKAFGEEKTVMDLNLMRYERMRESRSLFLSKDKLQQKKVIVDLLSLKETAKEIAIDNTLLFKKLKKVSGVKTVNVVLNDGNGGVDFKQNEDELSIFPQIRGMGDFKDDQGKNNSKYWNTDYRLATISFHLNQPLVGVRVENLTTFIDNINRLFKGSDIVIEASGEYVPMAIYTTYINEYISHLSLSDQPRSYLSFVENPMQKDMYSSLVPNALKFFDLPDLVKLMESRVDIKQR